MPGLWLVLLLVVCLFTGLAVGCVAVWRGFGQTELFVALACYAVAALVADMVCGIIFYTYGKLTIVPPKRRA